MALQQFTSSEYHRLFSHDHCNECGALVGLGGPTDESVYGWAALHISWHNAGR